LRVINMQQHVTSRQHLANVHQSSTNVGHANIDRTAVQSTLEATGGNNLTQDGDTPPSRNECKRISPFGGTSPSSPEAVERTSM